MHTKAYRSGFIAKCAEYGVSGYFANALLKESESSDPNLQRASEIFKDWLTTKKHTVRSGEILSGIARKYNVPMEEIMKENNMTSVLGIKPGQQIRIPVAQKKEKA